MRKTNEIPKKLILIKIENHFIGEFKLFESENIRITKQLKIEYNSKYKHRL